MAMSIQRQADQYDIEVREPAPRLAAHEVAHLLHSGRRIQAGTLNTRQSAEHPFDEGDLMAADPAAQDSDYRQRNYGRDGYDHHPKTGQPFPSGLSYDDYGGDFQHEYPAGHHMNGRHERLTARHYAKETR